MTSKIKFPHNFSNLFPKRFTYSTLPTSNSDNDIIDNELEDLHNAHYQMIDDNLKTLDTISSIFEKTIMVIDNIKESLKF
jgi:hypothetical protein